MKNMRVSRAVTSPFSKSKMVEESVCVLKLKQSNYYPYASMNGLENSQKYQFKNKYYHCFHHYFIVIIIIIIITIIIIYKSPP